MDTEMHFPKTFHVQRACNKISSSTRNVQQSCFIYLLVRLNILVTWVTRNITKIQKLFFISIKVTTYHHRCQICSCTYKFYRAFVSARKMTDVRKCTTGERLTSPAVCSFKHFTKYFTYYKMIIFIICFSYP